MLKPWCWIQLRNCNAEHVDLKYHPEPSKITIKWKVLYIHSVVFDWRVFNLFLPGILACTLWPQHVRSWVSESCPACRFFTPFSKNPTNLWLLLTFLFRASFFFMRWLFDRDLLLFEESPSLLDGLMVHQSLEQYEILVNSIICLMVQIPICHLFNHLVLQSLLEALHASQGCKESQSKASMSLLWLGSLVWGRTKSFFLLVSFRTYF